MYPDASELLDINKTNGTTCMYNAYKCEEGDGGILGAVDKKRQDHKVSISASTIVYTPRGYSVNIHVTSHDTVNICLMAFYLSAYIYTNTLIWTGYNI